VSTSRETKGRPWTQGNLVLIVQREEEERVNEEMQRLRHEIIRKKEHYAN
jgi:hypothetical protein